jgi:hypothetical protein
VYRCENKKLYEIVMYEESFLSWKILYVDEQGLKDLYDEKIPCDFSLKDGYLLWEGDEAAIDSGTYNKYLNTEVQFKNSIRTLYDDLNFLIDSGACYVSSSVIDSLEDPLLDHSVSSFSGLNVSQSTMKLYLRVKKPDGWTIRPIVEMDGSLIFNPFHVIIPSGIQVQPILDVARKIKEVVYQGNRYDLYFYDRGRSIYPHMIPFFKLIGPIVNHKLFFSEQGKVAERFLGYYIDFAYKAMYRDVMEEQPQEKKDAPKEYKVDRSGVFFRILADKPKGTEYFQILSTTLNVYEKMLNEGWQLKDGISYLRSIGYDPMKLFASVVLIQIMSQTSTSMFDRIDTAKLTQKNLRIKNLKIDLELFALRAAIWVENYEFPFRADKIILQGGQSPYSSEAKKVNVGGRRW